MTLYRYKHTEMMINVTCIEEDNSIFAFSAASRTLWTAIVSEEMSIPCWIQHVEKKHIHTEGEVNTRWRQKRERNKLMLRKNNLISAPGTPDQRIRGTRAIEREEAIFQEVVSGQEAERTLRGTRWCSRHRKKAVLFVSCPLPGTFYSRNSSDHIEQ